MVLGGLVVSGDDVVVFGNVVVGGDVAKIQKKSSVSWVLVRLTTRSDFETVRFSLSSSQKRKCDNNEQAKSSVEKTLSLSSLLTGIPLKHLEIIQIQRNRIKNPNWQESRPILCFLSRHQK